MHWTCGPLETAWSRWLGATSMWGRRLLSLCELLASTRGCRCLSLPLADYAIMGFSALQKAAMGHWHLALASAGGCGFCLAPLQPVEWIPYPSLGGQHCICLVLSSSSHAGDLLHEHETVNLAAGGSGGNPECRTARTCILVCVLHAGQIYRAKRAEGISPWPNVLHAGWSSNKNGRRSGSMAGWKLESRSCLIISILLRSSRHGATVYHVCIISAWWSMNCISPPVSIPNS